MLAHLRINDVVLIEKLEIEFKSGLCALTGETGAGKSILLDSLGLALGARAETGLIRRGAEQASVSAVFQIPKKHPVRKILKDAEIGIEQDELILRRVVGNNGKSRAFINDQPVSLNLLRSVGQTLVEIHGQFDNHGLLNPQTHRAILDDYAGIGAEIEQKWEAWKAERETLEEMQALVTRARTEEEFLRTALEDLDALEPRTGEEGTLGMLRERLMHREQVLEALNAADQLLNGGDDPVRRAWSLLDRISDKIGADLQKAIDSLDRGMNEIQEASSIIRSLSEDLQEADHDLAAIDERLHALRAQARKHDCLPDELPQIREDLARKLGMIADGQDGLAAQARKVDEARKLYQIEAEKISARRWQAATQLNARVQKELAPLKLEKARFVTSIEKLEEPDWGPHGMDRIAFLVSTNPGTDPGPLHKIASGGEMSRFMLALKVVSAQAGSTHSFIFDEVDTGIGGGTADAVGERLARLAKEKQVLVVTHAPQIAARASHHWVVEKTGDDLVTTTITPLESRVERAEEIARMLSGSTITPEARAAAESLLRTGTE
ncbi:MAG: DNA repair protein RecN [Alphaproteobacteria bacterium]|nr:DNA repair protein RecN [Alphaproteobacteria bacterium]